MLDLSTLAVVLIAIAITALVVFVLMSIVFVDYVLELLSLGNRDKNGK